MRISLKLCIVLSIFFAFTMFYWSTNKESLNVTDPALAIHSISGKAKETILLTPSLEYTYRSTNFVAPMKSYGLELNPGNLPSIVNLDIKSPITIEKYGSKYLYFNIDKVSGEQKVRYDGKEIKVSKDLDMHDSVVHEDGTFTFIEYLHDTKDRSVYLGLKRVNSEGRVLWSWDSRRHISKENYVKEPNYLIETKEQLPWHEILSRLRKKYSELALNILGIDIYERLVRIRLHLPSRTFKLFDSYINLVDFIHANSIQYLDKEKYILVSARNLDTLFIIEVKTGLIVWSLGGPHSRFTKNRVVGDPRGGFSHQHDAYVYKNRLYLYDNANMLPGLPSRAVVYTFDMKDPNNCRFLFEYLEPYGKRRLSMGSIQPLNQDRILIGWGGVPLYDRFSPSAAASIVSMKTKKTEWQVDFKPGWTTYQTRGY